MIDKDGYPEENDLKLMEKWEFKNPSSFIDLMELVKENWQYADIGYFKDRGRIYWLSTAGWSGNEEIIEALRQNIIFWITCWVSSKRGGHYKFVLPPKSFWEK